MGLSTLTTFNGAQFFAFYGQTILGKIFQGGSMGGLVTVGSVMNLMLVVESIAQFSSMFIVRKVTRRGMLLTYALLLICLNSILALVDIANVNFAVVGVILMMIFTQECLGIPVMGLYAIEITNNSALGVIQLYNNLIMLAIGYSIPQIVAHLSVPLLFFICSAVCGLFFALAFFFVRETSHLTDKEKKSVYAPKKLD